MASDPRHYKGIGGYGPTIKYNAPPLAKPDPVTIHDLCPHDKARAIIYKEQGVSFWKLPD